MSKFYKYVNEKVLDNKTVLITGGTGSFGKQFVKKILQKCKPQKIIVYSRDELKQFEMLHHPVFYPYKKALRFFVGDVRDFKRLNFALENVDYVVHAAALKQVPTCEYNPFEAVKTNVIGGQNVIEACITNNIKKVVALSTDKAAAPINLYGATKLTSDKLFIAANNYSGRHNVNLSVVRYGNVMGSRGSVIPFLMKQKETGKINITDPKMTRFNITLDEGVDLVLLAFSEMMGGELFVPKIPSYKIMDLAKAVAPGCEINMIGIRPGEKIHEEMITKTDSLNTIEMNEYYIILPSSEYCNITNEWLGKGGRMCDPNFSYNSGDNVNFLSVDSMKKLIEDILR
jgi:UDP-N-acetylglucosamine 4,6-dehydratase/5-epimerase